MFDGFKERLDKTGKIHNHGSIQPYLIKFDGEKILQAFSLNPCAQLFYIFCLSLVNARMSLCVRWRKICQHLGRSHADREGGGRRNYFQSISRSAADAPRKISTTLFPHLFFPASFHMFFLHLSSWVQ